MGIEQQVWQHRKTGAKVIVARDNGYGVTVKVGGRVITLPWDRFASDYEKATV